MVGAPVKELTRAKGAMNDTLPSRAAPYSILQKSPVSNGSKFHSTAFSIRWPWWRAHTAAHLLNANHINAVYVHGSASMLIMRTIDFCTESPTN